jgi:hypothetical protein
MPSFIKIVALGDSSIDEGSLCFGGHNASVSLSLISIPAEGGSVAGAGVYAAGSNVTVSATPNAGYSFAGWYSNGALASSANPYSFALESNDVSYEARFTNGVCHCLYLSSKEIATNPAGTCSVHGAGYYVAVTGTPAVADPFNAITWYDDSFAAVSTDFSYTFAMPEANVNLSADFGKARLGTSFDLGKYPQTLVEDSATLAALKTATDSDSDGYLEYGSDEYKKVTGAPYYSNYKSAFGQRHLRHGDGVLLQGRADRVARPFRQGDGDRPRNVREGPGQERLLHLVFQSHGLRIDGLCEQLPVLHPPGDAERLRWQLLFGGQFHGQGLPRRRLHRGGEGLYHDNYGRQLRRDDGIVVQLLRLREHERQDLRPVLPGFDQHELRVQFVLLKLRHGPSRRPHRLREGHGRLDVHQSSYYGNGLWWSRSPSASYSYNAGTVHYVGSLHYNDVFADYGVRPSFTVSIG